MENAMREAVRFYTSRNWREAINLLHRIEATHENRLDISYLLGLSHARLDEWDDSLLYLEQFVTSEIDWPRAVQCRLVLAYIYARTGRFSLAEYELDRLLKAGCESAQILAFLGYTSWATGRLDEALQWYEKAYMVAPENPTVLNGYGYVLACTRTDSPKSLTYCRKAVDMRPLNPSYLDSLAWAYFLNGNLEEAAKYIELAGSLAPEADEIRKHSDAILGRGTIDE